MLVYWVRYASSYLKLRNHLSIIILSAQRLLPSMLWRMWFSLRKFMYSLLVNWHPWSEFRITGFATLNAFFNAFMTILVSRVSSISQPTIQRLYQSITAVRYRNPRLMGMWVMPIDHAWFGRSITAFALEVKKAYKAAVTELEGVRKLQSEWDQKGIPEKKYWVITVIYNQLWFEFSWEISSCSWHNNDPSFCSVYSISDSLKNVSWSVLNYDTIIGYGGIIYGWLKVMS